MWLKKFLEGLQEIHNDHIYPVAPDDKEKASAILGRRFDKLYDQFKEQIEQLLEG